MNRSSVDLVWNLLTLAVAEILNPLLLISTALFVGVGYILTLLMPVNIDIWAALLAVCVVGPLGLLVARARRLWSRKSTDIERFTWRRFLPFLPLLIILPPTCALLAFPSLSAVAHMDLQFPFISQVVYRESPYESVVAPGNPSNQYWLYFVFVASIVRVTSLDVYSAWVLTNLAFVLATQFWIGRAILVAGLAKTQTIHLGLLIIFVFGSLNLFGSLAVLLHALNGVFEPSRLDLMLLEGADRRLHSVFSTVVHARGLSAGFTAFAAALCLLLNLLRDRYDFFSLLLFSAVGMISLAFMPTLAFFIAAALLGGLALTALYSLAGSREWKSEAVAYMRVVVSRIGPNLLLVWFVASVMLTVPLLKYVDDFSSSLQSSIVFIPYYPKNIRMVFASSALLIPLAGLQFYLVLRVRRLVPCFLGFSATIGLCLALTLSATADNQYKFNYPLTMLMALLSLYHLAGWRAGPGIGPSIPKVYSYALVILALLNAVYASSGLVLTVVGYGRTAQFYDVSVVYSEDTFGGRLPAFQWIRDNTPIDAVVIVGHAYTRKSKVLHERLNYAAKGGKIYADYMPGFDQRIEDLHTFYNPQTTTEDYLDLLESMQEQLPGRALYAVVMDPELSRESMSQRGAEIVFENPPYGAHVYLINPPASS